MDRTGIIVVSICVVLLGFWFVQTEKRTAHWQEEQRQFAATNVVSTAQPSAPTPTATSTTTTSATTVSTQIFDTNAPEKLIVITNADARYTFTSRGGGLKSVELLKYPETVSPRWQKEMATNAVATLNTRAPLPMLAILGGTNLVGDGNFTLTKTDDGVRAEKSFADGLILTKEFHVSSNYLINASVSLKNSSDKPLA
ncbi:MAG: membrane protein insertase YidC, partial [Limisphaerales bacterium]